MSKVIDMSTFTYESMVNALNVHNVETYEINDAWFAENEHIFVSGVTKRNAQQRAFHRIIAMASPKFDYIVSYDVVGNVQVLTMEKSE